MKEIYLTGERPKPEEHDTQCIESLCKYDFVKDLANGKTVIDIGCGFGQGANLLADYAKKVTGIDNNCEVIREAKKICKKNNVEFMTLDAHDLKFNNETFDAACAFEVIEHLTDYRRFLAEVDRVLKPNGVFIVSTPNRKEGEKSHAPFHIKEFSSEELKELLERFFRIVKVYGMKRPIEVYRLESELSKVRNRDIFGLKKIIPRKLISKIVYCIAKIKKIKAPQEIKFSDFIISEPLLADAQVILAVCWK